MFSALLPRLQNIFRTPPAAPLRVCVFGIMNNPDYRQEVWRESVAQRLICFDAVCLVCGREEDLPMLAAAFPEAWQSGKLKAVYKHWPFPEWSYEELPRHLNAALSLAREQGCEWLIKLDLDTVLHEKDTVVFQRALQEATRRKKWVVSLPKIQFFMPGKYWRKGTLPVVIHSSAPIAYGFDHTRYTDLCQPIVWNGVSSVSYNGKTYDIPSGDTVPGKKVFHAAGLSLFNYDFTFRTYERSIELLYQIEMAHARFWGKGYSGIPFEEITRESAMNDFLKTSTDRYQHMNTRMNIEGHPVVFQQMLQNLGPGQWGFDLWNKILL